MYRRGLKNQPRRDLQIETRAYCTTEVQELTLRRIGMTSSYMRRDVSKAVWYYCLYITSSYTAARFEENVNIMLRQTKTISGRRYSANPISMEAENAAKNVIALEWDGGQ